MLKSGARDAPEALIVGLARMGDDDAFAELVRRRQFWLRHQIRAWCSDEDLADDLAQQTFMRAWKQIGTIREPRAFSAWLRRIARNLWLQHLRGQDPLRDARDAAPDAGAEASTGLSLDLEDALAQLPLQQRRCVVFSYRDGLSHGEIADITDLPLGTVKSHIRRGTAALQSSLAAYLEQNHDE